MSPLQGDKPINERSKSTSQRVLKATTSQPAKRATNHERRAKIEKILKPKDQNLQTTVLKREPILSATKQQVDTLKQKNRIL